MTIDSGRITGNSYLIRQRKGLPTLLLRSPRTCEIVVHRLDRRAHRFYLPGRRATQRQSEASQRFI
jgi:hypothetical protein